MAFWDGLPYLATGSGNTVFERVRIKYLTFRCVSELLFLGIAVSNASFPAISLVD